MMSCAEREDDAEELVWRDDTLTLTLTRDQLLVSPVFGGGLVTFRASFTVSGRLELHSLAPLP